jgi:hypothetical protein
MPRRFPSLHVRPGVYFALAALLVLMAILIDAAFIPDHRFSPAYFRAIAAFAVPALVLLLLGERSARKSRQTSNRTRPPAGELARTKDP